MKSNFSSQDSTKDRRIAEKQKNREELNTNALHTDTHTHRHAETHAHRHTETHKYGILTPTHTWTRVIHLPTKTHSAHKIPPRGKSW